MEGTKRRKKNKRKWKELRGEERKKQKKKEKRKKLKCLFLYYSKVVNCKQTYYALVQIYVLGDSFWFYFLGGFSF